MTPLRSNSRNTSSEAESTGIYSIPNYVSCKDFSTEVVASSMVLLTLPSISSVQIERSWLFSSLLKYSWFFVAS